MHRMILSLLLIGMVAACSNSYGPRASSHTLSPDPADYHGVPTDDRPPVFAPAPDAPPAR